MTKEETTANMEKDIGVDRSGRRWRRVTSTELSFWMPPSNFKEREAICIELSLLIHFYETTLLAHWRKIQE